MPELKIFNREEALEALKTDRRALLKYNLSYADLRDADLSYANLRYANLSYADPRGADLRYADLRYADLSYADLRYADMRGANLSYADLRDADLDFSCLPLKCGGLRWKIDKRLAVQLAYHLCSMQCDDPEFIEARNALLPLANQFHRVDECGKLVPIEISAKQETEEINN